MFMVSSSSSVFVPEDSRPDYPGTSISRTILIFENSGGRCIRYREKSRKRSKLLSRDGIGLPPKNEMCLVRGKTWHFLPFEEHSFEEEDGRIMRSAISDPASFPVPVRGRDSCGQPRKRRRQGGTDESEMTVAREKSYSRTEPMCPKNSPPRDGQ